MTMLLTDNDAVCIPESVKDLDSFRLWVHSDELPEQVRVGFLNGEVWVDMSKEQFFSHNQVRKEFGFMLTGLEKSTRRGRFIPEGMLLSNDAVGLACQPDGAFVLHETFRSGQIRWLEGSREGYVELEGTPDMVLEILGDSSVGKDTVTLRDLYWQAGIAEYWLVDVRRDRLTFEILRHTARGYVRTRQQAGGWLKSNVIGKFFRLTQ